MLLLSPRQQWRLRKESESQFLLQWNNKKNLNECFGLVPSRKKWLSRSPQSDGKSSFTSKKFRFLLFLWKINNQHSIPKQVMAKGEKNLPTTCAASGVNISAAENQISLKDFFCSLSSRGAVTFLYGKTISIPRASHSHIANQKLLKYFK